MTPFAALLFVLLALAAATPASTSTPRGWPQWGGPDRNFVAPPADLATAWPENGPKKIWRRPLGDGFSSIVSDGATLYTLYRDGADDVAIAIDAKTGDTTWATKYAAPRMAKVFIAPTCAISRVATGAVSSAPAPKPATAMPEIIPRRSGNHFTSVATGTI